MTKPNEYVTHECYQEQTVAEQWHTANSCTVKVTEVYDGQMLGYLIKNWDELVSQGIIGRAFDNKTKQYLPDENYRKMFFQVATEVDVSKWPLVERQVTMSNQSMDLVVCILEYYLYRA